MPLTVTDRFRWWILLILLLPLSLGIARLYLYLDVEVLNLLLQNLAVPRGVKLDQKHFADARELIVTLKARNAEDAEAGERYFAEILLGRTNLVANVTWQPRGMQNSSETSELIASLWLNQPPAVFGELTNRLSSSKISALLSERREKLATSFSLHEIAIRGYDPYGLLQLPNSA